MNKDYVFHVNWDDRYKNTYKVGILAQIDELFYFILKAEENATLAYKNGFVGIPGFKAEEVYRSQELFDFFKSRVLEKGQINPCEELTKSKGVSMIDSFSVEEISEKLAPKYKKIILEAYELQVKKVELQKEREDTEIL